MDQAYASQVKDEERKSNRERISRGWRNRYEGSAAQDLAKRLGALDFVNWILIFGATLLLTVLPIILLLSSLASHRIDSDLARHLGLNRQGSRIVGGLFTSAPVKFDSGVVLSLLIGLGSAIAVAITVQIIYEKAFDQPHRRSVAQRAPLYGLGYRRGRAVDRRWCHQQGATWQPRPNGGVRSGRAGRPDAVLLVDDAFPSGGPGTLGAALPPRRGHCGLLARAGCVLPLLFFLHHHL